MSRHRARASGQRHAMALIPIMVVFALLGILPAAAEATFSGAPGRIVFSEVPPGAPLLQIASIAPDGTDLRQLTTSSSTSSANGDRTSSFDYEPTWSADGARIAYANEFFAAIHVTPTLIDFEHRTSIRNMAADGSDRKIATATGVRYPLGTPAFSADGASIAYECPRAGSTATDICVAPSMGPESSVAIKLVAEPGPVSDPTYASDGRLFFVRNGYSIWERRTDGVERQVVLSDVAVKDPSVSPDGQFVAYARDDGSIAVSTTTPRRVKRGSKRRKGAHRAKARKRKPVTRTLVANGSSPAFSPDCTRIAFVAGGAIHVIPFEGGSPQPLTAPRSVFSLDWGANPGPGAKCKTKRKKKHAGKRREKR